MAKITNQTVDALKPGQRIADSALKGFIVRRLASGAITYGFRYRDKATNRQRWLSLGLHGKITPSQARIEATRVAGEVASRRDPMAEREASRAEAAKAKVAEVNTVDAILDTFIARYVKNLRSAKSVIRSFEMHVRPRIGKRSIYELTRREIVEMLDHIADNSGRVMADRVLAHVRKAFNWQATRDDNFMPPIVRGMARTKPKDHERKRALEPDEIRSLWKALDSPELPEAYRRALRVLLLTGARRNEVCGMVATEIKGDGWLIPEARYKTGKELFVPLTTEALKWIGTPKRGFVFSTDGGKTQFSGFSKAKAALDAIIAKQRKADGLDPMEHWTHHDLRRTARSLMSRAGVTVDIAERVLGHEMQSIRRSYDRHSYADEKRDALEKLAGLIHLILNPPQGNVLPMKGARQ